MESGRDCSELQIVLIEGIVLTIRGESLPIEQPTGHCNQSSTGSNDTEGKARRW